MTLTVTEQPNFPFPTFYFILFIVLIIIVKYQRVKLKEIQACLNNTSGQRSECAGRYRLCNCTHSNLQQISWEPTICKTLCWVLDIR